LGAAATTTTALAVLGTSATNQNAAAASTGTLPRTGLNHTRIVGAGIIIWLVGLGVVELATRRQRRLGGEG
jgi:hypothetical protein